MRKLLLVLATALFLPTCGIVSTVSADAAPASAEHRPSSRSSAVFPFYAGVVDDLVKSVNYDDAYEEMRRVKEDYFNTVRITTTHWQRMVALTSDERMIICNAARAAEVWGVQLVVTVIGDPGNPPLPGHTPDQYEEFTSYLKDIVDSWLGQGEFFESKGVECASAATEIIIEPWNEPNLPRFMRGQERSPDGYRASAWTYARFMAHLYPALKQYGAEIGARITIWGGAVGSSQDPINFIRQMGKALRHDGHKSRIMDAFTCHPYEDNSDVAPGTKGSKGAACYGNVRKAVRQNLFCHCPIIHSEYGAESTVPVEKAGMYSSSELPTVRTITERKQGEFYVAAFKRALTTGARGMFIFKHLDECNLERWQSGIRDCRGGPKESLYILAPFLKQLTAPPPATPEDAGNNPDPLE